MEPKNGGLEDDVPFQTCDFQVPCYFFRCVKEVISLGFLPPGLHFPRNCIRRFVSLMEIYSQTLQWLGRSLQRSEWWVGFSGLEWRGFWSKKPLPFPETISLPLKIGLLPQTETGKLVFQPSIFGKLLVLGRVLGKHVRLKHVPGIKGSKLGGGFKYFLIFIPV